MSVLWEVLPPSDWKGARCLQFLAVAGDNVFVPVKALLARAGHIAGTIVMFVDVDKAVALAVLTGGEGDAVDAAPRGIAH